MYDEDKPVTVVPIIKAPSANAPQVSSTGLFIPYALNKKKSNQSTKSSTGLLNDGNVENDDEDDDDDDDNQTDFLGLTKSSQVQISTTDVESVLRETFPRARHTAIEQPVLLPAANDFEDLDQDEERNQQHGPHIDDDDEVSDVPEETVRSAIQPLFLCLAPTLSPEEWTLQRDQTRSYRFDVRRQWTFTVVEECHWGTRSNDSTSSYSSSERWSEKTRPDHLSRG